MDIPSLLQQLPPGIDVYDFLAETITTQAYPDLGRTFSVQVYVATTLCCVVISTIIAGLFIRWKKGRLRFFVADGPATRPNPKLFVPALWLISGICIIAHTFWLRSALKSRYLPYGLGVFWWLFPVPLTCSYAIIATFPPSILVINCTLLAVCVAAVCPLYIPANLQGTSFQMVHDGYVGLQGLIGQAKATGNVAVLASSGGYTEMIDEGLQRNRRAIITGGAIYSTQIVVFFLFGLIPSLFLNAYMRKKIDRLQRGLEVSSQEHSASMERPAAVPLNLESKNQHPASLSDEAEMLTQTSREPLHPHLELELPKDRPFANLAPTALLPQNYATIMEARVDPQEKARRLTIALRRDNLQLGAYFLMLAAMASLAFYQAAKGPWRLDTKAQFLVAYTWAVWAYLVPAIVLACAFLYDSMASVQQDEEVDIPVSPFSGRQFQIPPLASIQLSQTVQVVEEHALEEKKTLYERFSV